MSDETVEEGWWARTVPGTTRKLILTWFIVAVALWLFERNARQQTIALQDDLTSTKSAIARLNTRIQQGDTSVIAEMESMRDKVAAFDSNFRLLSQHVDEAKSNQAVARAKVADLRRESSVAKNQLQALRKLVADWSVKASGLMESDSGRRVAKSPTHLVLAENLLCRDRPTEVELTAWAESLEALTPQVDSTSANEEEIAITPEHQQLLKDLSQQLGRSRDMLEQQLLMLDAVLVETASQELGEQTLGQAIQDRRLQQDKDLLTNLSDARETARLAAQAEQTVELARLESELVEAATKRQVEELKAKQAQAEQVAKAELARIAEETRLQEAKVQAQSDAIRAETDTLEATQQRQNLEREFERDLPAIRSLLSAFLSKGHQYRSDNAAGPASLGFLRSQGALEPTPRGSYQMAFLANSGTRPPGGLKNPANPDLLRQAQDLLNKYGELMVQKEILAP
ncbi:MAG: hypothetical protein JNL58_25270 [Planctomyces sp.]|nr:hypothetical protein [Planctomyces sp.]